MIFFNRFCQVVYFYQGFFAPNDLGYGILAAPLHSKSHLLACLPQAGAKLPFALFVPIYRGQPANEHTRRVLVTVLFPSSIIMILFFF
jgi:hypothetical protein